MLITVVGNEMWLISVIIGEIEVETFVDEVIHLFAGSNIQVFNGSFHDHIFIDFEEGQHNVFVCIVGFLKVHFIVELIFEYLASAPFGSYQILCRPLKLCDQTIESILVSPQKKKSWVLLLEFFYNIQFHMHSLIVDLRTRNQVHYWHIKPYGFLMRKTVEIDCKIVGVDT